jgi:hypothetical protein
MSGSLVWAAGSRSRSMLTQVRLINYTRSVGQLDHGE